MAIYQVFPNGMCRCLIQFSVALVIALIISTTMAKNFLAFAQTEYEAVGFEPLDLSEQHDSISVSNYSANTNAAPNYQQAIVETNSSNDNQNPFMNSEVQDMESAIASMNYRLKSNEDAHVYLDRQLSNIEMTQKTIVEFLQKIFDEELNEFESKLIDLEANLTTFIEKMGKVDAQDRNTEDNLPPFRLIAIDSWQSNWNAVLSFAGRMTMIEPGESRSGWRLIQINPMARTALFRNDLSNQEVSLEVNE